MTEIKEKIILGDFPQKIHIKTQNEENPVLLFLHGGPGVCNRHNIFAIVRSCGSELGNYLSKYHSEHLAAFVSSCQTIDGAISTRS